MAWRIQATYVSAQNPDFVYSLQTIGLISGLELWLGIIVACMPTIAPVLQTYVRPTFQRLTSYYHSRRSWSKEERGSSHKPVSSEEIQLKDSSGSGGSFRGGPRVGASSLSTKVSSLGRRQPTDRPGAFERALRDNRGDNSSEGVDDEGRILWTAGDGGAWHTGPRMGGNFAHVEDEMAGTPGIHVHHELDRQEEYRQGAALQPLVAGAPRAEAVGCSRNNW